MDDLDLEMARMTVRWIRQFIKDDEEWNRGLSWSRDILFKTCTAELKETIMREELEFSVQDKSFQGDPITLVLIIKHLSGLSQEQRNSFMSALPRLISTRQSWTLSGSLLYPFVKTLMQYSKLLLPNMSWEI